MAAYDVVLQQALTLDLDDRAILIARLTSSIESDACDPFDDPEFRAEIARRSREAHDHPERLIPWETVRAELVGDSAEE
jgi:putative addiction module component (TIGR02574 family)